MPARDETLKNKMKDSDETLCKDDMNCSFDSSSTASTLLSSFCRDSESDFEYEPLPNFRSRPLSSFGSSSSRTQQQPWPLEESQEIFHEYHFKGKGKQWSERRSWLSYLFLFAGTVAFVRSVINNPGSGEGAENYNTWMQFMNTEVPFLKHKIGYTVPENEFTILLKGNRIDFIHQSIDAHSRCGSVKEIQLDFGSKPVSARTLARDEKVTTAQSITTNAVLLLSQDVLFSCQELDKAFLAWKSDTSRLAGFFGYQQILGSNTYLRAAVTDWEYAAVQTGSGTYSVVSDRAVFANALYIESIPTYDYRSSSCPLLLSLQVSTISEKAPLIIKANPRMLSSNALEVEDNECLSSWLQVNLSQGASTLM